MLERLNSLWVGEQLGYIEQLCLVSALAVGHPFTLYSYNPRTLRGVPDGIEVRDAREIMSETDLHGYYNSTQGSDFFRYALMTKSLGYWVDMDVYFLRPLNFKEPYVFGWEYDDNVEGFTKHIINGAILRVPAQSDMLRDLRELPTTNWRPSWFGPKRTLLYYYRRLTRGDVQIVDLPAATFGPELVTYVARKHGVANRAQKPSVFYPVRHKDIPALFGPANVIENMLTPDTLAVHMYRSRLAGLCEKPPPPGSYLELACRRHDIDTNCGVSH